MMTSSTEGAHRIQTVPGDGLLQGLEQRVGGASENAVSRSASSMMMIRQRPTDGRLGGQRDEVTDLLHLDGESLGGEDVDVGVRRVDRGAALSAVAAPSVGALQRRGEGPGGHRAARTRAARSAATRGSSRPGRSRPAAASRSALSWPMTSTPDGHGATRPSWSRRPMTSAWICSTAACRDDEVALGVARPGEEVLPDRPWKSSCSDSSRSWTSPRRCARSAALMSTTTVRSGSEVLDRPQ